MSYSSQKGISLPRPFVLISLISRPVAPTREAFGSMGVSLLRSGFKTGPQLARGDLPIYSTEFGSTMAAGKEPHLSALETYARVLGLDQNILLRKRTSLSP